MVEIIWLDKVPNNWDATKWIGTFKKKSRRYRTILPKRVELRRSFNGINILIKVYNNTTEMSMNGTLSVLGTTFFEKMIEAIEEARWKLRAEDN